MDNKKRVFTVLCIDGGGVRGVIPARILQEIEARTGKPIAELFDMVGGTSTGGIIGACLVAPHPQDPSKPRYTAKETLSFYHTLAGKVFPEMRFKSIRKLSAGGLYDPKPLEDGLRAHLGEETKVKDMLTSFMVCAADIKNFKPVWITHLKGQKDASPEGWDSMLLREAIRAATSAPTYFPARYYETTPNEETPHIKHRHALIDGGFFGGNAMQHLLGQAQKIAPPDAEIVLVHLGTGSAQNGMSPEEFNAYGPLGLTSPANGNILMSLVIRLSVQDCENDMRNEMGDRFFSFDEGIRPRDKQDGPSISMDDSREENMKRLEKHAEKIIGDNSADLDRLCAILKSREFIQEKHLESQDAFQKLTDKMAAAGTVKSLMLTYQKIVSFSAGLESPKPGPEDADLKALAGKLNEQHKAEMDRIYRVLLDKKQHQGRLLNAIKEAGENINDITKKIFEPFKDAPQPPANDDKPPSSTNTNNPPKRDAGGPGL